MNLSNFYNQTQDGLKGRLDDIISYYYNHYGNLYDFTTRKEEGDKYLPDNRPNDSDVFNLEKHVANEWLKNFTSATPEALKRMIKFVSITSAQIGSKSQPASNGNIQTKQDDMIQQVQNLVQNDPSLDPNNISTDGDVW